MGQRHQIYLRVSKKNVVGLHHQWLYGRSPILFLANVVRFLNNHYIGSNPLTGADALDCLKAIYAVDPLQGRYEENSISKLSKAECRDPRKGDNNDGITVIDLSDYMMDTPKIRYGFVALSNSIECVGSMSSTVKPLKPMTAEQYVTLYYPRLLSDGMVQYSSGLVKEDASVVAELSLALKVLQDNCEVLTQSQLKDIFPALFN